LEFHRGRRWSGISVSANPGVHRCWRCVDHDRDRRADRRLRRSWHPAMRRGTPGLEQACSSIRRRHRPCAAPRSDEARQGHTGLEQAARRGPADDPLADPNATRFYERGADRRVALGRRCPAACSRGVTLTSGVTGSADPNIKQAFGRVGELADPVIIVPPSARTLALRRS